MTQPQKDARKIYDIMSNNYLGKLEHRHFVTKSCAEAAVKLLKQQATDLNSIEEYHWAEVEEHLTKGTY